MTLGITSRWAWRGSDPAGPRLGHSRPPPGPWTDHTSDECSV